MTSPRVPSAAEIVRAAYLERQTGTLEVGANGQLVEVFFLDGEAHLERSDSLAAPLRAASSAQPAAVPELRQLATKLAHQLAARGERVRFDPNPRKIPRGDLAGPLPTVLLAIELAAHGLTEPQLLERVGGEGARFRSASETPALAQLPWLDPEMNEALACLQKPTTVSEIVRGGQRSARLRGLAKLRAVGLAVVVTESPPVVERAGGVSAKLLERFLTRVGEELDDEPVRLPVEKHRELLADLLARLGGLDHYQLLGLARGASVEAVHTAYEQLARRVHPRHAARLGLAGKEEALKVLFERVTEAFVTLTDPARRVSYHMVAGLQQKQEVAPAQREAEKQRLAGNLYRQGVSYLSQAEYSTAVDLLKEAARLDPKPDHLARLAQAQAKNPRWHHHAVESYRRAAELAPRDAGIRMGLGEVLEAMGQLDAARSEYRAALERMPDHAAARKALDKLGRR